MKLKKGDTVMVLSGKDKNKKGKILESFPGDGKLIVERVNVVKKHQKPTREFQGGIIEKPMAIYASKVMLVCPRCSEPSRVRSKKIDNKRVRECIRCGEIVDKV